VLHARGGTHHCARLHEWVTSNWSRQGCRVGNVPPQAMVSPTTLPYVCLLHDRPALLGPFVMQVVQVWKEAIVLEIAYCLVR
jgi:hypothetical protein